MDKQAIIGSILIAFILVVWFSQNRQNLVPETTVTEEITNPATERLAEKQKWVSSQAPSEQVVLVENKLYKAYFNPLGARLNSLLLKEHFNASEPLDMLKPLAGQAHFFTLDFPSIEDAELIPYSYEQLTAEKHRFRANIALEDGKTFTIIKDFTLSDSAYMMKLDISIEGDESGSLTALSNGRELYELRFAPQIGPDLGKIGSNRTAVDIREYKYYDNQKVRSLKWKRQKEILFQESLLWASITGKYFSLVALPGRNIETLFVRDETQDSQIISEISFRKIFDDVARTSQQDTYYYYLGPRRKQEMAIFEAKEDNDFGLSNLQISFLARGNSLLGWLETPIKWTLQAIYNTVVPNYGVAIIILAILIRLLLMPLTLKSTRSTVRMQQIQPQMKALQERYRSDPMRMQRELSQLYKREGVSPLGGCLPILLQMPIIIALANLFSRYFEFRGAVFIPGWIEDLSAPEMVYSFSIPDAVPLLGESLALRVLPIIYLGSQLLLTQVMQQSNPSQQMGQMKIMLKLMPFLFFFILYNLPSGLIMYWTISNFLIMIQHLFTNHRINSKALAKVSLGK